MEDGLERVRAILGGEAQSGLSDGVIRDALWETYFDVEQAVAREAAAKAAGDVELELEASHQLIQGREGTLLPAPYDNERYPDIKPAPVEVVFEQVWADPAKRRFWGLE